MYAFLYSLIIEQIRDKDYAINDINNHTNNSKLINNDDNDEFKINTNHTDSVKKATKKCNTYKQINKLIYVFLLH